jgi:hypothetical protein
MSLNKKVKPEKTFRVIVEHGPTQSESTIYIVKARSVQEASAHALEIHINDNPSHHPVAPLSTITVFKEGGNALRNSKVTRIPKEEVSSTVKCVSTLSGVPLEDLHILGSTGKNKTSGDMDLGIDVNKYDPEQLHQIMVDKLGTDYATYNKGNKIGSYAVPIGGNIQKGLVQVDFMYVQNTEWAKFSYFSAGEQKSKFKGVVRTILLRSIASALYEEGVDMLIYDAQTNDLIIRIGRSMDMTCGLRRIFQLRPKKKRGEGYLVSMKTVTLEELEATYPGLNFDKIKKFETVDTPDDALKIMFGFPVKTSQVETAEQIIQLIEQMPINKQMIIKQKSKEHLMDSGKFTEDQVSDLFKGRQDENKGLV